MVKLLNLSTSSISKNGLNVKPVNDHPCFVPSVSTANLLGCHTPGDSRKGQFAQLCPPAAPAVSETDQGLFQTNGYTKDELAQVWGEFLEPYAWDWFATLTFKDCTHPESAGKVYDNWIHTLNRDSYGQAYWKDKSKGVFYARGTEYQRRGVIHYHALIGGIPDFVRLSKYVNWWKAYVAPQVAIEKYDRSKGGRFYMAKSAYTFKRGEIDCNDALVRESQGSRTCAKVLHNEFVRAYADPQKLHASVESYRW